MSSPTMNVDLTAALKRLRLGRIAESLPERLTLAEKQKLGFEELLLIFNEGTILLNRW